MSRSLGIPYSVYLRKQQPPKSITTHFDDFGTVAPMGKLKFWFLTRKPLKPFCCSLFFLKVFAFFESIPPPRFCCFINSVFCRFSMKVFSWVKEELFLFLYLSYFMVESRKRVIWVKRIVRFLLHSFSFPAFLNCFYFEKNRRKKLLLEVSTYFKNVFTYCNVMSVSTCTYVFAYVIDIFEILITECILNY